MTGARILELLAREIRDIPSEILLTRLELAEAIERASERAADEQWQEDMGDDL